MQQITAASRRPTLSAPQRRRPLAVQAYSSARTVAPASSLQDTEAAVKTLGQAYINHRLCRELELRPGREQELFQGLARVHLDTFSHDNVLLLSDCQQAAGIVLSGQQEAQLVQALAGTEFNVIAGTLQILQTIPEARLPKLIQLLQELQLASAQAAQDAGHSGYLKLTCLGVRPEAQGKGLGRALLASALAQAQEQRQPLFADVADATTAEMLQRHSFKPVGTCGIFTQLVCSPV